MSRNLTTEPLDVYDIEDLNMQKRGRSQSSVLYSEALKKGILKKPILK